MRTALLAPSPDGPPTGVQEVDTGEGCAWWNLVCHGGTQVADSGMSALTSATAHGANQLLGEIVKTVDESTQVPLTDPTYQEIYTGFLGLAAPLLAVVLFAAAIIATLRRDAATLARAVTGLVVAGLGGAMYLVLAQLLVGLDNWLAHGIVEVTGQDLTTGLTEFAAGFERITRQNGPITANMLMLILMLVMLVAGIILWFVLVLRQIAILVVVAFAPLLVAGYLWAPTRPWVRRATEVLVALVFTKTAIYALFGIGLALLARGAQQSLSTFVGALVLLCGACFAPLVMLRLVHFAADTQIAGEMMGTLRGGVQPVLSHLPATGHLGGHSGSGATSSSSGSLGGRGDLARQYAQGSGPPRPEPVLAADGSADGSLPTRMAQSPGSSPASAAVHGGGKAGAASSSATGATGAASSGAGGAAAGAAGLAGAGLAAAATVGPFVGRVGTFAADTASTMASSSNSPTGASAVDERPLSGPPPVEQPSTPDLPASRPSGPGGDQE